MCFYFCICRLVFVHQPLDQVNYFGWFSVTMLIFHYWSIQEQIRAMEKKNLLQLPSVIFRSIVTDITSDHLGLGCICLCVTSVLCIEMSIVSAAVHCKYYCLCLHICLWENASGFSTTVFTCHTLDEVSFIISSSYFKIFQTDSVFDFLPEYLFDFFPRSHVQMNHTKFRYLFLSFIVGRCSRSLCSLITSNKCERIFYWL